MFRRTPRHAPLALALVLVLATVPARAGEPQDVEPALQTIERLRHQGEVAEAARRAGELVASHPGHLAAHIAYQDAQIALGRRDELLDGYRDRARADGATADDRFLHARLLEGAPATHAYKTVLADAPDHFWSLCGLATLLIEDGKARHAAPLLERAREIDATSPVPLNLLGGIAESEGDTAEAERLYREAITARPSFVLARVNLGTLLVGAGRLDEALTELDAAVESAPRLALTRLGRGMAHMARGDSEKAVVDFQVATETDARDVVSLDLLANAYLNLRRYDEAQEALDKALALDPAHAPTHVFVAYLNLSLERIEPALAAAEAALDIDPALAEAHHMLGLCHERAGSAKRAEAAYRRAQRADPENPAYVRALGLLYESQSRWRDAVREYEKLVKLTDGAPDALFDLALAYWGHDKHDRAATTLETLIAADEAHLDAWMNLGVLRHRYLRDRKGARAAFEHYLKRGGTDERVRDWLRELD